MSRLDDIVSRIYSQAWQRTSKNLPFTESDVRFEKEQVKSLFIQILDTTDILGPEHPQTNLWYRDLKKKVEEL